MVIRESLLRRYTELDSGMLCKLFRSEDVYIPSADDHTKPDDIQRFIDIAVSSPHIYVMGRNPKHEAFIFAPSHNANTYQAHFAVRKDRRDGSIVQMAYEAGKWLEINTTCTSIICFIREDNVGARSVLSQLGMRRSGRISKSVLFNGEYRDEIIYHETLDGIREVMEGK